MPGFGITYHRDRGNFTLLYGFDFNRLRENLVSTLGALEPLLGGSHIRAALLTEFQHSTLKLIVALRFVSAANKLYGTEIGRLPIHYGSGIS